MASDGRRPRQSGAALPWLYIRNCVSTNSYFVPFDSIASSMLPRVASRPGLLSLLRRFVVQYAIAPTSFVLRATDIGSIALEGAQIYLRSCL